MPTLLTYPTLFFPLLLLISLRHGSRCRVGVDRGEGYGVVETGSGRLSAAQSMPTGHGQWSLAARLQGKAKVRISLSSYSLFPSLLCSAVCSQDRGMPSDSTCRFLSHFHRLFPSVPLYGLFDADAGGILIFKHYKYGSARSAHESVGLPTLQLIGLTLGRCGCTRPQHAT